MFDKGRLAWETACYGKSGELFVFNRARRFQKSSGMSHANDLHHLLHNEAATGGKKAILLVTDNGLDWNPRLMQTFYALRRLWRDLQLDGLVQVTYAAGYSRYNMIERAWPSVVAVGRCYASCHTSWRSPASMAAA